MSEMAAAVQKRKGKLKQVPVIKKAEPEVGQLPNAIKYGIAHLRKTKKRRDSMGEARGTQPAVSPAALIKSNAGKKKGWKPKKKEINVDGIIGKGGKLSQFSCRGCSRALHVNNIIETHSGNFHPDCFFCMACTRPIIGEYLSVNGIFLHPECLNCSTCNESLIDQGMMIDHDAQKLYCAKHAPRDVCLGCSKKIDKGQVIKLGDRIWHANCFKCNYCGIGLSGQTYLEQKGKYYCKNDYWNHIATRCNRCDQQVSGRAYNLTNPLDGSVLTYHMKCYKCAMCEERLKGKSSRVVRGDIYCDKCYVIQKTTYATDSDEE